MRRGSLWLRHGCLQGVHKSGTGCIPPYGTNPDPCPIRTAVTSSSVAIPSQDLAVQMVEAPVPSEQRGHVPPG